MEVRNRYERYIWIVLLYTIVVILWGAMVRATGSGAGCGDHWPLCNGEVIPREPQIETIIELSHRITSGLLLFMVAWMTYQSFKLYPKGNIVRKGAVATLVFVIIEALIGAVLVLFELVAHNASLTRAFSMAAHLVNTLLLLAAMTLTGLWARGVAAPVWHNHRRIAVWTVVGVLMMMLLGASGGIAALGDTLFPKTSFVDGLYKNLDTTSNILLRLRVAHPAIAVGTGFVMVIIAQLFRGAFPTPQVAKTANILIGAYVAQLVLGTINVVLLAPIPIQILHLFLSNVIWIAFVVLVGLGFAKSTSTPDPAQA
jgi:cytochrome c oxidase assembly protein subunit 15